MPDTGAPWNIPYVENADLVRDWPADSLLVANAVAAGLSAANVGIGSNVVQTVKTDTFSASVANAGTANVTGLAAEITPSSDTAKVLVLWDVSGGAETLGWAVDILRGGNLISAGAVEGSRSPVTAGGVNAVDRQLGVASGIVLDAPGVNTAVTYQVRIRNLRAATDTLYVNRNANNEDASRTPRSASRITLIEVAA